MDISKIEQYYQNEPEFRAAIKELSQHVDEFFHKEMENRKWTALDIEKRIIQVAAAWYNLTQEQHKTKDEALKEIMKSKGTLYDPIAVEGFLEMYKKGLI